jgi:uncharacterized protein (DUF58 family)
MRKTMATLTAGTVARAYLIAVLVLSVLFSSPLQLGIALCLVAVQLYSAVKPPKATLNLVLVVGSLVLAPIALEALAGLYAVLLIVPALFLLDWSLKNFTLTQTFPSSRVGRSASDVLKSLGAGLLLVLGVSVILWNELLMLTSLVLMSYLAVVLAGVFHGVPKISLAEDKTWRRLLVGDLETVEFAVKGKAKAPVFVSLAPVNSWVHVEPPYTTLQCKKEIPVAVRFIPPLAGPSKIQIQASCFDSRGLIQTGQILEPVDLHIIPRAKYAKWLANKFLEQTSTGAGTSTGVSQSTSKTARSGVEFLGSRPYQSGDRLKDIDWKHSYMLGELIVKEFAGGQGQVGIIAADLTAKDAEEADKLAYNFVMSALTLAIEALPSALAVYNTGEVLAVTKPMNPRETLKKTLELTEKITVVKPLQKVLAPAETRRIKRTIGQLSQMQTESAQKLGEFLEFESEAHKEAARTAPATLALAEAVKNIQGPAVITVVSSMNNDSESLLMTLQRLREKGYGVVMVGAEEKKLQ